MDALLIEPVTEFELKECRIGLGLNQKEFAETYSIPLRTLQNWEQGRISSDTTTSLFLRLIINSPGLMAEEIRKLRESDDTLERGVL
jgi:DNA-binding transcriptional regulator YiaG